MSEAEVDSLHSWFGPDGRLLFTFDRQSYWADSPEQVIEYALALLKRPGLLCAGAEARDATSHQCDALAPGARSWDALGALKRVSLFMARRDHYEAAFAAVIREAREIQALAGPEAQFQPGFMRIAMEYAQKRLAVERLTGDQSRSTVERLEQMQDDLRREAVRLPKAKREEYGITIAAALRLLRLNLPEMGNTGEEA
jgi:hypothetical protein